MVVYSRRKRGDLIYNRKILLRLNQVCEIPEVSNQSQCDLHDHISESVYAIVLNFYAKFSSGCLSICVDFM